MFAKARNFWERMTQVINERGFFVLVLRCFLFTLSIPITAIVLLIWPFHKIRFINLYTSRIGEYALNMQVMLCTLEAGDYPEEKNCSHFFFAQYHTKISNTFFHKLCGRSITVVTPAVLWSYVDRILTTILDKRYVTAFKTACEQSGQKFYKRWEYLLSKDKKQFLHFSENEKSHGNALLTQLGIPQGKPFVCLLIRDSQYLKVQLKGQMDFDYHAYRNASLENFVPALEYLISHGFYIIRMGKFAECPATLSHPQFIDYAMHPLRSDFLDIYLCATCSFFISTNTGLDGVASAIFNKPLLSTNFIPSDFRSALAWHLAIPKKVFCKNTSEFVPYHYYYQDYFECRENKNPGEDPRALMFKLWKKRGWYLQENSPDEILQGTKEMLKIVQHQYHETDLMKKMQGDFWNSFPVEIPYHFSSDDKIKMRISDYFLNKNQDLFCNNTTQQEKRLPV